MSRYQQPRYDEVPFNDNNAQYSNQQYGQSYNNNRSGYSDNPQGGYNDGAYNQNNGYSGGGAAADECESLHRTSEQGADGINSFA